MNALFLDILQR